MATFSPQSSTHLQQAINAAELAGHTGTAAALKEIYRRSAAASAQPPASGPFPWATVTGRDFGRSIAWAREQGPSALTQHIREQKQRIAP